MRRDEQVVVSRSELELLRQKAARADAKSQLFASDEMQVIREQYEEKVAQLEERCEHLEFQVRMELCRLRDVEVNQRRFADEVRRIETTLQNLLGDEGEDTQVRSFAPAAPPPVIPQAMAPVLPPRPTPPPPPAPRSGSHAEAFKRAMSNRKLRAV
jgi:hypothetical protein